MQEGWLCPKCKIVYTPHISHCSNCYPKQTYLDAPGDIKKWFDGVRKEQYKLEWPNRVKGIDKDLFSPGCFS